VKSSQKPQKEPSGVKLDMDFDEAMRRAGEETGQAEKVIARWPIFWKRNRPPNPLPQYGLGYWGNQTRRHWEPYADFWRMKCGC
jgi:hypothetical protein